MSKEKFLYLPSTDGLSAQEAREKTILHSNVLKNAYAQLEEMVREALDAAVEAGELPEGAQPPAFAIELPAQREHGDFSVNAAMVWARTFRMAPAKLAQLLLPRLNLKGSYFERAEMAGPGFLNFFATDELFSEIVQGILAAGEDYGRSDYGAGKRVLVEFVSANPTGPMHMGNARGGAIGDVLAQAMQYAGFEVEREFYINDAGNQIEKFGQSLEARYLQQLPGGEDIPFPEDGYHGDDITERAKEYIAQHGDGLARLSETERRAELVKFALPKNIDMMKTVLAKYRIEYDTWFSESTLHESGAVREIIEKLSANGLTYEKEGALWYNATAKGAEKDEVLIRANGQPTYFAADIAYHYDKLGIRGFDKAIDIWGADHHGHVARMKGAMEALGLSPDGLDILLMQLVRLLQGGQPVKMSKRSGKAIALTDLLDEVPIDAARFFFNMREATSALDFDLDLAIEQSAQNPVYYVQYAHARICSILRTLGAEGISPRACTPAELSALDTPEERRLTMLLSRLPNELCETARTYDTARLTHFAIETANLFHKFYTACRVKGEPEPLLQARLALCMATRTVLANLLSIMKVEAPQSM